MFIHDIIKMEYIRQGYLPDYPYHLTSDTEMFDAFIVDQIVVSQEEASKIIYSDISLWDSPNTYVGPHGLSSFEFIISSDEQSLVIRGRRDKLSQFCEVVGLSSTCELSPECYFAVNYPLLYDSLSQPYKDLVDSIYYHISAYLDAEESGNRDTLPSWIYSYMNGSVVGINSSQLDMHDLFVLLNLDNIDDTFTEQICHSCLDVSKKWIAKLPPSKSAMRPPTMYGELHVIKSLRVAGLLIPERDV